MKTASENRPILKIKLARVDILIEIIAFLLLIACWLIPALMFGKLPAIIPTHFGINGKVDDWGNRASIFILPSINLIMFIGLSILNKFPHVFNYPVKVTNENAMQLYTKSSRLIRIIKLIIDVIFLSIEWQICNVSKNATLSIWFLVLIIIIPVVLPMIMAIILTRKQSGSI
jgi:uncharacterized membrane protein